MKGSHFCSSIFDKLLMLYMILREWSERNDKQAHVLLGIILTLFFSWLNSFVSLFNWTHAITGLFVVEGTQTWIFGFRIKDTLLDLLAGIVGVLIGLIIVMLFGLVL